MYGCMSAVPGRYRNYPAEEITKMKHSSNLIPYLLYHVFRLFQGFFMASSHLILDNASR
jgi:hypothetical protein